MFGLGGGGRDQLFKYTILLIDSVPKLKSLNAQEEQNVFHCLSLSLLILANATSRNIQFLSTSAKNINEYSCVLY